ncbi:MAG: hypothetical protein PF961_16410 [Planctomycetota bacterium]|nr:hypothetical protein [Planctomycetota bacterium]
MRALSCIALLGLVLAVSAAELKPHKATVYTVGRDAPFEVFIVSEDFDKLVYSQDDGGRQRGEFKQKQIASIEYAGVTDGRWYTGRGKMNGGDLPAAIENFAKVSTGGATEYDRIQGFLSLLQAYAAAGKVTEAAAAADAMAEAFPRSAQLLDVLEKKAQVLLKAKKLDEADAAYADLAKRDLGPMSDRAKAIAIGGKATVQGLKGDHAGAATTADAGLKELNRDKQEQAYASLAIIGVREKLASGDVAGASALAGDILYLGDSAAVQAEAHLVVAESKAETDKAAAFDHAVIAYLRAGDAPELQAKARSVARKLGKALSDDESLPKADRLAYKTYTQKL